MRTRVTRSGGDRGYTPRQNYNRLDEPDSRGPRYNSPGRYRDFDYNSSRDLKDNFNPSRDFNYRDYNSGRDYNPREYNQHRDYPLDYHNSKGYSSRDYPGSRDFLNSSRDYPNSSRDFHPSGRDYHQNSRDFHGSRDFQNSRDYPSNNRDYPPSSREFNRYHDYPPSSRSYPPNNRDMAEYDKFYQDRRYYRDRPGPYDRRNLPRQGSRRLDVKDYDYDSKRSTGPLRRYGNQQNKIHRTKVFIGNLSGDVTQEELTNKFSSFGPINRIDFRRKFAFVDYVRSKDADAAIREMHNKMIWGSCLKVQPHIDQHKKLSSREPKPSFQITVTNLDQSVSWQDLKDFARQIGDVNYASIIIKGDKRFGLIEYTNDESVKNAMKDLNGKKIVNNKLELIHIPVSEFLKNLGYNNENLVVEEQIEEDTVSNSSQQQNESHIDDKFNNDTFEAEDKSQNQDDLYQEGNLDTVDYN